MKYKSSMLGDHVGSFLLFSYKCSAASGGCMHSETNLLY